MVRRASVAVVGVGHTPYGKLPDYDAYELGLWALKEALADGGLIHPAGLFKKMGSKDLDRSHGLFRHFFERNQRFWQGLTAINDERLPGNIPGLIGCEEQYRVSDVFNRP
jgi:hypothetical protein